MGETRVLCVGEMMKLVLMEEREFEDRIDKNQEHCGLCTL